MSLNDTSTFGRLAGAPIAIGGKDERYSSKAARPRSYDQPCQTYHEIVVWGQALG